MIRNGRVMNVRLWPKAALNFVDLQVIERPLDFSIFNVCFRPEAVIRISWTQLHFVGLPETPKSFG